MLSYFKDLNIADIKGKSIILDIDGTIVPDGQRVVGYGVEKKIKELAKYNKVMLLSNKNDHKRNMDLAKKSGVEYINTDLKKPNKNIEELINDLGQKRLVIGDKFLTDGLFAQAINADFIKVERLISHGESVTVKLINRVDDFVYGLVHFFKKR